MNKRQIQWTIEKCNSLIEYAKYPLTEHTSKYLKQKSEEYYKESKRNLEVKQALVSTLAFINNLDIAHRKYESEIKKIINI